MDLSGNYQATLDLLGCYWLGGSAKVVSEPGVVGAMNGTFAWAPAAVPQHSRAGLPEFAAVAASLERWLALDG